MAHEKEGFLQKIQKKKKKLNKSDPFGYNFDPDEFDKKKKKKNKKSEQDDSSKKDKKKKKKALPYWDNIERM